MASRQRNVPGRPDIEEIFLSRISESPLSHTNTFLLTRTFQYFLSELVLNFKITLPAIA